MHLSYYRLKTGGGTFYVKVENMTDYVRFHIGAKKKCMVIDVYLDGDIPNLTSVSYNENCTLEGNMASGIGTIIMVKAGIKFVTTMFPNENIKQVMLKDISMIPCRKRMELSLSKLYIAKYNSTWYEKNLGARLATGHDFYMKQKAALKEYFKTKPHADEVFGEYKGNKQKLDYLKNEYLKTNSLLEFIKSLEEYDCYMYIGWLEEIVDKKVGSLHGRNWIIETDYLKLDEVNMKCEQIEEKPMEIFTMYGGNVWERQTPL